MKIKDNFGEILTKVLKFRKYTKSFPGNFPEIFRKIPGKLTMFFDTNAMLQS